jgi:hypothetical protein
MNKLAFSTNEYRGHNVRAYYVEESGDAEIEVCRPDRVVRVFKVPAYKIWNYAAHDTDLIDSILDKED